MEILLNRSPKFIIFPWTEEGNLEQGFDKLSKLGLALLHVVYLGRRSMKFCAQALN